MAATNLKAPFPYFGGKSRVGHLVWDRFGDVSNYVEPFAGSLAVLLARPHEPRIETVNDRDAYLSNFWRALQHDPEGVAKHADWPVSEADLHSRHRWLVGQHYFRELMLRDPDFYDAKVAGWWVWGISQWIGSGWCTEPGWTGRFAAGSPRGIRVANPWQARPSLTGAQGIHNPPQKRPQAGAYDKGIHSSPWIKRPSLGQGGKGVHQQIPDISGSRGAAGRGIHASALSRKLPAMDRSANRGVGRTENIVEWMRALSDRLRKVRVCCGDWSRILGPSPTFHIGLTGVFLDPPYDPAELARTNGAGGDNKGNVIYGHHDAAVSADVRKWALENGDNPKLRIALCGYDGEHDMEKALESGWTVTAWKASGGYAKSTQDRANSSRERIWFSPHCLPVAGLFEHNNLEETA